MPLPTPTPEEEKSDFIERCMIFQDEDGKLDLSNTEQRKQALAICFSQYRKHTESTGSVKSMTEILNEKV